MTTALKVHRIIEVEVPGLGSEIEKARRADGRSLRQLSDLAGMTEMNWRRIESETTKSVPIETLQGMEKALGVSFGVELDEDND